LNVAGVRLLLVLAGFVACVVLAAHLGPAHWGPWVVGAGWCVLLAARARIPLGRLSAVYALGAAAGLGTLALCTRAMTPGAVSPWTAIACGVLFSCLAAYLLAGQAVRLHGHYLAMATLGFGVILSIVFLQWEPVTGGTSGIYGIPNLSLNGFAFDSDLSVYYLVWGVALAVIALSENIVNSRVGRAFRAVHSSEVAAATLGVDTTRYKVQVFVLSAALASLAGSLYAHYVTFISPEPFGFKFSVQLVVMVVVGGMASIWGAIFGAATVTALGEALRGLGETPVHGLGVPLSDCDVALFGLILMVIMVYMPAGLVRCVVDSAALALRASRLRRKEALRRAA
ncbi:MAG: branched-chain amino acid ABC transporter permease, partial [Armatimonadota bacterium]|nr:branched-chain amino acid ABC transporter permease [Armatimonadota bacterium]